MLMDIHRVEGIKYNFDRLTDDELENMRDHLITRHQRLGEEIALIDNAMFERNHDQIPFDVGVIALSQDVEIIGGNQ
jgi:hypothetical protein